MKLWLSLAMLAALTLNGKGQDVSWIIDQAPGICAVLVKALEKAPPFSARVAATVSGATDAEATAATGAVESHTGQIRWTFRLADIHSPQLSQNAKTLLKRINGEQLLVLTRPDQKSNYLVLAGARACVEQPLPAIRLEPGKAAPAKETIDGHLCVKEKFTAVGSDGSSTPVVIWRAKELKNLPLRIEVNEGSDRIQIQFKQVRLSSIVAERFRVPPGLAHHASLEDLVQSVLFEKMKKRLGLPP